MQSNLKKSEIFMFICLPLSVTEYACGPESVCFFGEPEKE